MTSTPQQPSSDKRVIPVEFWEGRYTSEMTPWDLYVPAPPLVHLMKAGAEQIPPGTMAALGSGRGHDAAFFGSLGFDVTGFDFAPSSIELAREAYGDVARFEQADIFHMPAETDGMFDYVLEHTCFCAIHPDLRQDYVRTARRLLKPDGCFIGLFWAHNDWGGPPYRVSRQELVNLFSPAFELNSLTRSLYSHPMRKNEELLGLFTAKR